MTDAEPVTVEATALARPRLLTQNWCDLSFLHWAIEPDAVARYFPPGVQPDVFDGSTYVGLVPFRMVGSGLPHGPAIPWLGTFRETNVRLYSVDSTGRRGVVFLSLDADRALVVAGARSVFGLPYRWARMRHRVEGDLHTYTTTLRWPGASARSRVAVRAGKPFEAGPLEQFLTARWGLHVARFGRTWYLPNEHPVWSLRRAELVDFEDDGLLASVGLAELTTRPPDHLAFSDGVPATFGAPVLATRPRRRPDPGR